MTGNRADALACLDPEAPDGLMIVSVDPETARTPSFATTPADFRQRFVGTFSADGNTITGA